MSRSNRDGKGGGGIIINSLGNPDHTEGMAGVGRGVLQHYLVLKSN